MAGIKHRAPLPPQTGVEAGHLQYLIRAILAAADPGEDDLHGDPQQENILVDIDLDGIRYLLIQMPVPDHNRNALSPRELEIARMVAQGHQNKIIASILNISTWTVCAHVRRIFAKLGVSSRAAMVARLLENDRLLKSTPASADLPRAIPPLPRPDRQGLMQDSAARRIEPRNSLLVETAKRSTTNERGAPRPLK